MPLLTAEQIKAETAKRRKSEEIEVEELGGSVRLLELMAGDLIRLQRDGRDEGEVAFEYVARSWVTEANEPLLPIEEGVAVAKSLSNDAYATILTAVLRLNGIGKQAIEEASKN